LDVRGGLDGRVTNSGVARYRDLAGDHLRPVVEGDDGERTMWLQVETASSKIRIAEVARLAVSGGAGHGPAVFERSDGRVAQTVRLNLRE
ncbi:MAG: glycoside hydrolase family 65 protein, partial [Actinobacteria bacterium]|nr:glycoside hydrolase family 65 protein [Actinomycetota bacterium]